MDVLMSSAESLDVRQLLVILDTCFAGLALQSDDALLTSAVGGGRVGAAEMGSGYARYLLLAGTDREYSVAGDRWQGSLFTDAIIRGLSNAADLNRDSVVTVRELFVWLQPEVRKEAAKIDLTIRPLLKDLGPKGVSDADFEFAVPKNSSAEGRRGGASRAGADKQ
jgi:hypothetical protein